MFRCLPQSSVVREEESRVSVRVIAGRAYHAMFMHNLLIRPTKEELRHFKPDVHVRRPCLDCSSSGGSGAFWVAWLETLLHATSSIRGHIGSDECLRARGCCFLCVSDLQRGRLSLQPLHAGHELLHVGELHVPVTRLQQPTNNLRLPPLSIHAARVGG